MTWELHYRRLAANATRLAMHRIGQKSGLIPEEDFSPIRLGLAGNRQKRFPLPLLDGSRVTLIDLPQRLLRRQIQSSQQFADGS